MINVLITAGGTRENIDSVRSITNHATGRLGSRIADAFAHPHVEVTYVCGEGAELPTRGNVKIIRIKQVGELMETLETLLTQQRFDGVIHSMAVSDFTPQAVLTLDEMAEALAEMPSISQIPPQERMETLRAAMLLWGKPLTDKKISSQSPEVFLLLKQAPKVISRIKIWQPSTLLVGFKLLSGVSEEELLRAGQALLVQHTCDFVLANDLANISGDNHKSMLLNKDGVWGRADTKSETARMIYEGIAERLGIK